MTAYLYQAPNGVPGDISRPDETNVEPANLVAVSGTFAQAYGIPMAYVAGGISQFITSNVAADFAGILARAVPGISGPSGTIGFNDLIGNFTPNPQEPQGLVVRGYVNVVCTIGTPVRGGIVYVRVVAASGKFIGDIEATADGSNNVALSTDQASWATDGKDASNNAELRIRR
jgi:hypothetical protein